MKFVFLSWESIMTDQVFSHCNISAFASFTFFECGDPENSAVFVFNDDTGKTVMLSTTLQIAAEMRMLLNKAFSQLEVADTGARAAMAMAAAECGSKPH